jgi:hypothetical protein
MRKLVACSCWCHAVRARLCLLVFVRRSLQFLEDNMATASFVKEYKLDSSQLQTAAQRVALVQKELGTIDGWTTNRGI